MRAQTFGAREDGSIDEGVSAEGLADNVMGPPAVYLKDIQVCTCLLANALCDRQGKITLVNTLVAVVILGSYLKRLE